MAAVVEGEGKSTHPVTAHLPDVTAAPLSLHSGGCRDRIVILIDGGRAETLCSPLPPFIGKNEVFAANETLYLLQ